MVLGFRVSLGPRNWGGGFWGGVGFRALGVPVLMFRAVGV